MASLPITVRNVPRSKRFILEMDAERFERLAATFGFFNNEFIKSIECAERDIKAGRFREIKSFKDLSR